MTSSTFKLLDDTLSMNEVKRHSAATLLFAKPSIKRIQKVQIDGHLKEVTPGPADYAGENLLRKADKYSGITIPRSDYNSRELND